MSDPDLTLKVHFSPLSESLIFKKSLYEFTVNEDSDVGSVVGDIGVTGAAADNVRYQILSGNQRGFFQLDPRFGFFFGFFSWT